MTNKQKFLLVNDGDGHWYIIPADKKPEFDAWIEAVYGDDEDVDCSEPDGFLSIDGPHSIIIHSFSEV